jgi:hypothetical protein
MAGAISREKFPTDSRDINWKTVTHLWTVLREYEAVCAKNYEDKEGLHY